MRSAKGWVGIIAAADVPLSASKALDALEETVRQIQREAFDAGAHSMHCACRWYADRNNPIPVMPMKVEGRP